MSDDKARKAAVDEAGKAAATDAEQDTGKDAGKDAGKAPGADPGAEARAEAGNAGPREDGGSAGAAGDAGLDAGAEANVIAELEARAAEYKDRMLRTMAELENVRRRAERDRKEAEAYGGTRLARDLLPVYDNLERALAHADETARAQAGAVIEGIELTRRELLGAFQKHRIEKFTPEQGQKFDPHFQQAMYEAPVPGATPGTVIEVIQAGFTIAGRLLRPALVGVAKAVPEENGGAGSPAGEPGESPGDSPGDSPEDRPGDSPEDKG